MPQSSNRGMIPDLAALLAWIDGLGATGLDGRDLSELGLKNGNLTSDDQRNGKQWDIPRHQSQPDAAERRRRRADHRARKPASGHGCCARPSRAARAAIRMVEIETERLPAKDLLLALRIGDGQYEPNMPVSARIRASDRRRRHAAR